MKEKIKYIGPYIREYRGWLLERKLYHGTGPMVWVRSTSDRRHFKTLKEMKKYLDEAYFQSNNSANRYRGVYPDDLNFSKR